MTTEGGVVIVEPGARALRLGRTLSTAALLSVAAVLVCGLLLAAGSERLAYDFRAAYLPAAEALTEGKSPYETLDDPVAGAEFAYVYPPQLALALVPFTALSDDAAAFIAFVLSFVALVAALAVIGVRDVRCYAALLIWAPAWNALETANVSVALALGVALAWRFRRMLWPLATVLGLVVSLKLFLWPLLVWSVALGRARAAGLAVALGVGVTLASWAAIGFEGLLDYPDLLRVVEFAESYSIVGMVAELGLAESVGRAVAAVVGLGLLVLVVARARRGDDLGAFTCAIAAALAFTPVVWQHYLVLFAVPLAVARPRFSAVWLLPILLWVVPRAGNGDLFEPFLPAVVVGVIVLVVLARRSKEAVVVAPAR